MPSGRTWFWGCGLLLGLWLACAGALAQGDPPGRVGRIAALQGAVWLFEPEQGEWVPALANRPFTEGDRLATAQDASAEVRIGSTTLWLGSQTEIEALRLDDLRLQFRMQRGQMALQLRSDGVAAELEIAHPEVRLQPARAGLYRVDRLAEATDALVWRGALRVEGQNLSMTLQAGQRAAFWREGPLGDVTRQWLTPQDDEFARAVQRQDQAALQGTGSPFVSSELTGAEELQQHGQWQQHPDYGAVWAPLAVAPGWAPYRYGVGAALVLGAWSGGAPTGVLARAGGVGRRPAAAGTARLSAVAAGAGLGAPGAARSLPATSLPGARILAAPRSRDGPAVAAGAAARGARSAAARAKTSARPAAAAGLGGRDAHAARDRAHRALLRAAAATQHRGGEPRAAAAADRSARRRHGSGTPAATTMAPPAAKPAVPSAATAQPQPAFRPPKPEPFTPAPAQPAAAGAQDPRAPGSEPRRQAPASRPPMRER